MVRRRYLSSPTSRGEAAALFGVEEEDIEIEEEEVEKERKEKTAASWTFSSISGTNNA